MDAFGPKRIFVQFHTLSDYHILLLPYYHIFIFFAIYLTTKFRAFHPEGLSSHAFYL